jgi:hypothetical protein
MRLAVHADDVLLRFGCSQEQRHEAMSRANDAARGMVARALADAPPPDADTGELPEPRRWHVLVGLDRDDRSTRQQRFYWGVVLRQISEQAPGHWTADAWHEAFKRTILGYEIVRAEVAGRKRPTVYRRLRSTSTLTVREMSAYLDQIIATAVADLGVVFDFDGEARP